jgi:hypothetical protein
MGTLLILLGNGRRLDGICGIETDELGIIVILVSMDLKEY